MVEDPLPATSRNLAHPKYRPDLDGLRALAVIAVVAYHAFPSTLRGGFSGVDVFFVISGYLISGIIFESLDAGQFSFLTFYQRRIRRIFPALLVILIACLVIGWLTLLDSEFKQLALHTIGGAAFYSNFIFWKESGYFDTAAGTKPLLHLWSLGIEEQFYIFWPLILWCSWKLRFNLLAITVLIWIASFALNLTKFHSNPVADFYSPQTRFWELLCGAQFAYIHLLGRRHTSPLDAKSDKGLLYVFGGARSFSNAMLRNARSILGMSLVVAGFVLIKPTSDFPGLFALLPTLGTTLMISAGPNGWVNRNVLANPLAVWIGKISFPLYLWHWPLLSFLQIINGEIPSRTERTAAVVASVILAWLTYRLIERPLRFGAFGLPKTLILISLMILVMATGFDIFKRDGLPFRTAAKPVVKYDGDVGQIEFHKYMAEHFYPCTPIDIQKEALHYEKYLRCFKSKKDGDIDIAIVGDSHAEQLFIGLAERLRTKNIVYYIQASAPFLSNHQFDGIFHYVLMTTSIKTVILTEYWAGRKAEIPEGSTLQEQLLATTRALIAAGKTVYLTNDVPVFPFEPARCKYGRRFALSAGCDWDKFDAVLQGYLPLLTDVIVAEPRTKLLDSVRYFCNVGDCSMVHDKVLMYRDNNHLNILGTRFLGDALVRDNPALGQ
jgi:peptidoglycan/LPS O-acetylase OafA/YrhL